MATIILFSLIFAFAGYQCDPSDPTHAWAVAAFVIGAMIGAVVSTRAR